MVKKILCIFIACLVVGCSYGKERVELMLDNPPRILEDSLYTQTQAELEKAESRYLSGEISYAEYVEKKKDMEDRYKQEADRRSGIIEGN